MRIASIFRNAPRLVTALTISVFVVACGGDDSDDVQVTDDPAPPMPATVNFSIGTKEAAGLTLTADELGVAYPSLRFNGAWNRTAQAWTLSGRIGVDSGASLFGSFAAQIIEPLNWTGDASPTAGRIEFTTPAGNSFFPGQTVQAAIDASALPVLLTFGTDSARYDWDSFEEIWPDDTQADPWRLASFGGAATEIALERASAVLELMAFVNANDVRIASAGAAGLETACSPRPGAATGTRRIALAAPDGELNPGDSLTVTYSNCWIDDPTDSIDVLLNGSLTLSGYIENSNPFSTGFDEIRFNSLSEQETFTSGQAVTVDPVSVVTTGTMTLFVTP